MIQNDRLSTSVNSESRFAQVDGSEPTTRSLPQCKLSQTSESQRRHLTSLYPSLSTERHPAVTQAVGTRIPIIPSQAKKPHTCGGKATRSRHDSPKYSITSQVTYPCSAGNLNVQLTTTLWFDMDQFTVRDGDITGWRSTTDVQNRGEVKYPELDYTDRWNNGVTMSAENWVLKPDELDLSLQP